MICLQGRSLQIPQPFLIQRKNKVKQINKNPLQVKSWNKSLEVCDQLSKLENIGISHVSGLIGDVRIIVLHGNTVDEK